MTSPNLPKSLDDSSNILWMSRNASLIRRPSFYIQRKQSLDSFSNLIRASADIELALRNSENEEEKGDFKHNNYDSFIDEMDFIRSPSALLDISDNIYRKGKVHNTYII